MMQRGERHNFAFTLIELIVVIIIIAIIAGFSAMSYSKIAKGMRMSSAKNTIIAALDNARALAIRNNRFVITVFRPRLSADGTEQYYEAVIAEWFGDSANSGDWTYDRFVPIAGLKPMQLPLGIGVAGPGIGMGVDTIWWVSTYLPSNAVVKNEELMGEMVGVLYSPEGKVVVRNSESASDRMWVDFDKDGKQTIDLALRDDDNFSPIVVDWTIYVPELDTCLYFYLEAPESEVFVANVNLLAVFDDDAFRELWGASVASDPLFVDVASGDFICSNSPYNGDDWDRIPDGRVDFYDRDWHYTDFINRTADRIQFNRYSGAPLK